MSGNDWSLFARRWAGYSLRTAPVDANVIIPAIEKLYAICGLDKPRVVVVSSPGVLAFAGTLASQIWAVRRSNPDFDPARATSQSVPGGMASALAESTLSAVRDATCWTSRESPRDTCDIVQATLGLAYGAADVATAKALSQEVWRSIRERVSEIDALNYFGECVRDAMRQQFGGAELTEMMASAAHDWAEDLAFELFGERAAARHVIRKASDWWKFSQPGNMSLYDTACIAAARDLGKVSLPEHRMFSAWELAQINGGLRYLHPHFCMVCDFPEYIDEASVVHPTQVREKTQRERCAAAVMRWRDGWLV